MTVLLAWQATRVTLNASFEKMIPREHPYIVNYLEHRQELAGLGNAVRIAVVNPEGSIYDKNICTLSSNSAMRCICLRGLTVQQ